MKLPRREFLHLAAGAAALPALLAHRKRASLSITAGPHQDLRIEVNHVQKTHCL
jgi:hypothetical protein